MSALRAPALVLCLTLASAAGAHEVRLGQLEIIETTPGLFDAELRMPRQATAAPAPRVVFPAACEEISPAIPVTSPVARSSRYRVDCGDAGLAGRELRVLGLEPHSADLVVRITWRDGSPGQAALLRAGSNSIVIDGRPAGNLVVADYLWLGIGHILLGPDHLLFVLCLLLIVGGTRKLVATITAFTLAHSLTLGLAVLGFISVPQAPVEAVIALSILLLATELARQSSGRTGLVHRRPWLVALCFGLLHGLGFAGALGEIGLPPADAYAALFSFNVGVEVGQLLFVALVLGVLSLLGRANVAWLALARSGSIYAIGGLAAFWTLERVAAF